MRGRLLLPAVLLVATGFMGPDGSAPRDPRYVNIVAACNPSQAPSVEPSQRHIRFADNVVWQLAGAPSASFVITPKDPQRWPFSESISGNGQTPASSGVPAAGTAAGTYSYNVIITCPGMDPQTIDPDIIIGEN